MDSKSPDFTPEEEKTPPSSSEKGKGKRRRRYYSDEMKAEIEEARKELREAKEERDKAKEERDSLKTERNNRFKEYETKKGTDSEADYRRLWNDAEESLKNAENALTTAQSAVDALQKKVNKLSDPDVVHYYYSSSSDSDSSHVSKSKKARKGVESIEKFWKNLHLAKYDQDRRLLELVEGSFFLGDPYLGHRLLIRQHYEGLLNRIQGLSVKPFHRAFGVVGTPGIGKTYFLYWLLWKLRMMDVKSVVLETKKKTWLFTIEGNVEESKNTDDFSEHFEMSDCWYLVDGMAPTSTCKGHTILATSPKWDNWYHFEKQAEYNGTILYLPLFSLDEMLECQKVCFPGIEGGEAGVKERYDKYGGVARPVLYYFANGRNMKRYDNAVNDLDNDFNTKLLSVSGEKDPKIVDRVIHMHVTDTETYEDYDYIIGSNYYLREISKRFWEGKAEEVQTFIKSSAHISMLAQIRGNAFEDYAHRVLADGGTFKVRNLETEEEAEEIWVKRETKGFAELSEIPSIIAAGQYGVPVISNLKSVDSVAGSSLLQMTVSLDHPEKAEGLISMLNVMKAKDARLVFVVPDDQYAKFVKQRIVGSRVPKYVKNLEQFVLRVDV